MKKTIYSLLLLLLIVSCSKDTVLEQEVLTNQKPLTKEQINAKIKSAIESDGDFEWKNTDAFTIWSALKIDDGILTVGYGNSDNNFERNANSKNSKDEVLKLALNYENINQQKTTKDILIFDDNDINVIDIHVKNIETVEALLRNNNVRYIEPAAYSVFSEEEQNRSDSSSSSGCGYSSDVLNTNDFRTISPGAKVPWSFDAHNIPQAWSYSTGAGVTLAVVDSGLSPDQKWMNQYFNDGYSNGRFVQKYGSYVDSWWSWSNNYDGVNDKCGHGTSMASVATAPRNNDNLPVGVAYNANLVTYRAVKNVIIDDYHEKRGVSEALIALGKRSDVKVISMSIGSPFSIGRVKDAVRYAYGRGKMIVAAGGTSTSFTTWYGVIFPANMSETVAVTGVKEGQYSKCDVCHTGSKIDFTVQMQRTNGTDNKVPVLSYYNGQTDYVGGSSVATATTAGIAALVWAKHPTWSRAQVLNKMKQSADFYPSKNSKYGYGNINALKAVQ